MAYFSLSLLGPFQAWTEDGQQQSFRTLKERALLAYLAVEHERPHRREDLADMLWPDRSEGVARNNLRQALFGVRQAVGEAGFDAIVSVTPQDVQVRLSQRLWLDTAVFDVLIQSAQSRRQSQAEPCGYCLQDLRDAVDLYRGCFLEDVYLEKNHEFQDWVSQRRERYLQQQMQALESLVELYETLGDYTQAVLYMLRLIQMSGANENLYRRLMLLLAQNGQFGAALDQYDILRRQLLETQGRSPGEETVAIAEQIQLGRFGLSPLPRIETNHNLPEQLTLFVGREMELAWLTRSLENPLHRLVCVVGPGGVGKTRLAIQAARMNMRLFPGGVFYIPFDTVNSVDSMAEYICRGVGLSLEGRQDSRVALIDYLRLKRVLLLLDNFEHLLDGRDLLLEILQAAPFTKALITSRERLHTQAEFLIELEGLPYQKAGGEDGGDGSAYPVRILNPALHLLFERAGRVRPDLARLADGHLEDFGDPRELEAALQICRLVGGLPLGIELAAGWARDFSFAHIANEIQGSLEFLQTTLQDLPERHRSLRASFEHSWDLLTENEQEVFGKLSVFPGSFTAQAAQVVAGAAFPWILRLVDKSLVRRHSFGRYDLHPLLRQYAGQKLRQFSRKAEDQARQQHARYFCAFMSERGSGLKGARQVEVLQEVELELENINAAWSWATEHQAVDLLQWSADGLLYFHEIRSRWREGEALCAQAVASLQAGKDMKGLNRRTLAFLLASQGWFCCRLTRFEQADSLFLQSLEMLVKDSSYELTFAHFGLGFLCVWMGRFKEALLHLSISLQQAEQTGDAWSAAWSRELLAEIEFESGRSGYQPEPFLDVLTAFERIGDKRGISRALNYLGNIAMSREHFQEAQFYFEKMQTHLEQIGDIWGSGSAFNKLGQLAEARGEYEQAATLFDRALAQLEKTGDQRRMAYTLAELGLVSVLLGQDQKARPFFSQALQAALRTRTVSTAQEVLTCIAAASIHRQQNGEAARLLGLILSTPVSDQLTARRAHRLHEKLSACQPAAPAVGDDGPAGAQAIWEEVNQLLQVES